LVKKTKNMAMKKYISNNESLGQILDFIALLSREMLVAGANLERITMMIEKIAQAYGLQEICPYVLSTRVGVSAKSADGTYGFRQYAVPPMVINLERLKYLNRLSYTVCEETPDPATLGKLLDETRRTKEWPWWVVMLIRAAAMGTMSLFFSGGVGEFAAVFLIVILLSFIGRLIERLVPEHMLANIVIMFIATGLSFGAGAIGLCRYPGVVIVTLIMLYLPGIPLVNAARNLFCGNEINGIMQLLKALLETATLAVGMILALFLFSGDLTVPADPYGFWFKIVAGFVMSMGMSVNFGMIGHDMLIAGAFGAICRGACLLAANVTDDRLIYVLVAAFVSSFLAEILVTWRHEPSTYFIYPSMIHLIPGDLFFYMVVALCFKQTETAVFSALHCTYALIGMSAGFILSGVIALYVRRLKFIREGGSLLHLRVRRRRNEKEE